MKSTTREVKKKKIIAEVLKITNGNLINRICLSNINYDVSRLNELHYNDIKEMYKRELKNYNEVTK